MQVVHVSGPQSSTTRTPISWVSWAWCRGTHTSDKPHPDLSARANEAALSSLPFPLSLLSFLPQIPQRHLLAPALKHGPQNSQGMGKQSLSHPQRKVAQPGEEEGAPVCLWGRGVPRALTPSPATGQWPSLTELAPSRLPNTDMNLPQPPGPSSRFPHPKPLWPGPPQGCTPTHLEILHTDPSLRLSRRLCPGTRPFCCLPTTHPARLPREQEPSLPSPTHSLTLLRLCTRSWGRGRRRWGLAWWGQAGWQAGSWLGRWCLLRPQAAWAWSGGGGEGRGRVQHGCI